jgi:hypothetical protein
LSRGSLNRHAPTNNLNPVKSLIFIIVLVACMATGCVSRRPLPDKQGTPQNLIGAWRLVSWQAKPGEQTTFPFGEDASGLLIYNATGRMSVFLSQAKRTPFAKSEAKAGTEAEKVAAFDSCFAYAGTYEVADGRLIHRLDHCTFPNWIGTAQVRFVRLDGDRLVLETPPLPFGDRQAVSRLVWERVRP